MRLKKVTSKYLLLFPTLIVFFRILCPLSHCWQNNNQLDKTGSKINNNKWLLTSKNHFFNSTSLKNKRTTGPQNTYIINDLNELAVSQITDHINYNGIGRRLCVGTWHMKVFCAIDIINNGQRNGRMKLQLRSITTDCWDCYY